MSDTVEKIKERLSVLDVVGQYVKLTRAGKYYKGLSPFTKEKTPSFFVSPDRGLYHCFSTGKGGDMFTFLQEMEGVDFRGSLKLLAEKAGVPLEFEKPEERDQRERLYAVLDAATEIFVGNRKERKDVTEYLLSRGLTDDTVNQWSVGYANKEWQSLYDSLKKLGFTDTEIKEAGLIKIPESEEQKPDTPVRFYDRFRGRIMFPIRDISGRVIAFSGRIFEDDPKHPQAKYLNSPETPVFEKSRVFYGLDKAREGIRTLKSALLVEGQIDLLMAHQSGYKNALATSGTSFTDWHADLIKRYSTNLLIAYDGDSAGVSAAGRASGIALGKGLDIKIVKLPPGKDPADILLKDKELFRGAVKGALHVVDFYLSHIADAKYDQRTFRLEVSRTVLPYIALIPHKIDQAHFVNKIAEVLGVPAEAVQSELKKIRTAEPLELKPNEHIPLIQKEIAKAEPFLSRADVVIRLAFGLSLLFKERKDDMRTSEAKEALISALGEERFNALSESDTDRGALFEADLFLERNEGGREDEALKDLYDALKHECKHEEYRETLAMLRAAEASLDSEEVEKFMKRLNELAPTLQ
ncbi:DNA primase [Patescibacteria group bacterium]|nr:MAG: DNA primase [Patescibacteria group bacterium]